MAGYLHPYFSKKDPERRWLFRLELNVPSQIGIGAVVLSFNAQSVTLPSVTNDPITIPHLNQDVKVAGRPSLGEMSVTMLTGYNQDTVAVMEAWHRLIYLPETERFGYAANYKVDGHLLVLYPSLLTYKTYTLLGVWPSSIGDREYDWTASEATTRTVTFQVDKVIEPGDRDGNITPDVNQKSKATEEGLDRENSGSGRPNSSTAAAEF